MTRIVRQATRNPQPRIALHAICRLGDLRRGILRKIPWILVPRMESTVSPQTD